jgi:hypothetical protein
MYPYLSKPGLGIVGGTGHPKQVSLIEHEIHSRIE